MISHVIEPLFHYIHNFINTIIEPPFITCWDRMQLSPDRKKTWYLAIFILLASIIMLPAYMAWEARTPDVTVMYIPGAPEGIVFIADPHIRHENIDTVRNVINRINRLQPALVLIGGDFTTPDDERSLPPGGLGRD